MRLSKEIKNKIILRANKGRGAVIDIDDIVNNKTCTLNSKASNDYNLIYVNENERM